MKLLDNDTLVQIVMLRSDGLSYRDIADTFGIGKSTVGDFLCRRTYKDFWEAFEESDKPVASGEIQPPVHKRGFFTKKRYVFTSAQNNTYVHEPFLRALEHYCDDNDAELVVGTFHYNKNAFQNGTDNDIWFDPKIRQYINDNPMQVFPVSHGSGGLVWCGELNILPTAVTPLSGLYNYTGVESGIVPHAKLQLESLATNKHSPAKIMYTTGTITQRNYVDMKAGQKASWHHVFSALVAEVDEDGDWFVRQLVAESDTGCFHDLEKRYTPNGLIYDSDIEAINWGDIHVAQLDQQVADISWRNKDSMLDTLRPKYQFLHDVYDQQARNHHNSGNPHKLFQLYVSGNDSVQDEITVTANEMVQMQRDFSQLIVVDSNHDKALERWLRESDYRRDPVNALTFLRLQNAKYEAIANGDRDFHLFEYAILGTDFRLLDTNIRFLRQDESFIICGDIECGQHGHNGANGSRGSVQGFIKQGMKMNTGHSHSISVRDGHWVAGVSGTLNMDYAVGASSWSNSHIVTYTNGKRAIITLRNGKWRA